MKSHKTQTCQFEPIIQSANANHIYSSSPQTNPPKSKKMFHDCLFQSICLLIRKQEWKGKEHKIN